MHSLVWNLGPEETYGSHPEFRPSTPPSPGQARFVPSLPVSLSHEPGNDATTVVDGIKMSDSTFPVDAFNTEYQPQTPPSPGQQELAELSTITGPRLPHFPCELTMPLPIAISDGTSTSLLDSNLPAHLSCTDYRPQTPPTPRQLQSPTLTSSQYLHLSRDP